MQVNVVTTRDAATKTAYNSHLWHGTSKSLEAHCLCSVAIHYDLIVIE